MELCQAAIAEVEKGQLRHLYAVQGKRQEALEIAAKLRRRSTVYGKLRVVRRPLQPDNIELINRWYREVLHEGKDETIYGVCDDNLMDAGC